MRPRASSCPNSGSCPARAPETAVENVYGRWSDRRRQGPVSASHAGKVYLRPFVSMRLAATLLADGAPCFAICACPGLGHQARLFVRLDHFSLEIVEIGLPIASRGKSSGDSKWNATLPHVELFPRRLERRLQLLELTRTPKRAHRVERAVVLLRPECDVADRLLVVSVWISNRGPDEVNHHRKPVASGTSRRQYPAENRRAVRRSICYTRGNFLWVSAQLLYLKIESQPRFIPSIEAISSDGRPSTIVRGLSSNRHAASDSLVRFATSRRA